MSLRRRHNAEVRWGYVREIDKRIHVGTKRWRGLPNRLKHLSAWRYMHKLNSTRKDAHQPVRMYGTRHRVRPSSDLHLFGKVSKTAYAKKKT